MAARTGRRQKEVAKHRASAASPFANIELVIEDSGTIHVGGIGGLDCVASAADRGLSRLRWIYPSGAVALIRRMGRENPTWGEERIANELHLKLGIQNSPRTMRKYKYLPSPPDPTKGMRPGMSS